ncbi:MAG: FG-GAP-like repeat-containing protein [Planctomycetota bacterium JB042]
MRVPTTCLLVSFLLLARAEAQTTVLHEWPGAGVGDEFGWAMDGAGDVDGDGVPDLIVGADRDDDNGGDSGRVSVFSGATGALLHAWNGSAANAFLGHRVAGVGDVDQDGFDDVLFSEHSPFTSNPGRAFLRSGQTGAVIHQWSGGGSDDFGDALAGLGDIDGDSVPDVAVAARTEFGAAYQGGVVRLFSGATGAVVRTYQGTTFNEQMGGWIAGGKDLSGDGVPDLTISTLGQDRVDVFSGATGAALYSLTKPGGFGSHVDFSDDVDGDGRAELFVGDFSSPGVASLFSGVDGQQLWKRQGTNSLDAYGWGVAALGDTNGDGVPDFAVGAYGVDHLGSASGVAQVLSGTDGATLVEYHGNQPGALFGFSVAGPGDVDGDGLGDVAVAAMQPFHFASDPGYVRLHSGACAGGANEYGSGLGGSGGCVPHHAAEGCPGITASFRLELDQALGGAAGQLFLGLAPTSVPLVGGTFLVAPPWVVLPLAVPGAGAGAGALAIQTVIPDDPTLQGLQIHAQVGLVDPGGPEGYALTNGLAFSIR